MYVHSVEVDSHRPPPPSFPYPVTKEHSQFHSSDSRCSEVSALSDASDGSESDSSGRKCGTFDVDAVSNGQARAHMDGSGVFVDSSGNGKRIPLGFHSGAGRAATILQKVYRSYRTRRLLADSAMVAEELWWQALNYAQLNHSTISFFNFFERESAASRWNRVSLNASKVGKGLSNDSKAQKLAFQHWIEAIDPRHRYGHSLHLYYEEWCKTVAHQPFFYWLDIGDGKEVDLGDCPRSKLRKQCIKYLGPQERQHYEYIVVEGKVVHRYSGNFLDTSKGLQGIKWIFVMSTSKKLYAGEKKKGKFHHSSFLAGGTTLAAGRLMVENGTLKSISAYSGHYRPTDDSLDSFLSFLKENGVDLDEVEIRKANEDYDIYEEGKSIRDGASATDSNSSQPNVTTNEGEKYMPKPIEIPQPEAKAEYKRILSANLQSPRTEVPKTAILERINSKKAAKSYQLGHQLSRRWSTGAGPRIGCVANYPMELRLQALEFTNLSPRSSPALAACRHIGGLASPLSGGSLQINNVDTSTDI